MARTIKDWDYFSRNVQSGLLEGRFMSGAFTLIAAGPPRLDALGAGGGNLGDNFSGLAWPIGIIQGMSFGGGTAVSRFFEIGSRRSYFILGRTQEQLSLQRVQYHGPNLLRALYAYMRDPGGRFNALFENNMQNATNASGAAGGKRRFEEMPGFENLWMNLGSDVFTQPIGLLLYFKDSNKDVVGAFYLENVHVTNYGMQTDANSIVLSESTSLVFERTVPVNVTAVSLIRDSDDIQGIVGGNVVGSAA